jgi:hypothetical protein
VRIFIAESNHLSVAFFRASGCRGDIRASFLSGRPGWPTSHHQRIRFLLADGIAVRLGDHNRFAIIAISRSCGCPLGQQTCGLLGRYGQTEPPRGSSG